MKKHHMGALSRGTLEFMANDDDRVTLLKSLKATYRERWAILLDSIFNLEGSERVALVNSFLSQKQILSPLLKFGSVTVQEAREVQLGAPCRHISSNLLLHYWTYPAAVLPVIACSPSSGDKVLVLGAASPGRFLAILQLLFNAGEDPPRLKVSLDRQSSWRNSQNLASNTFERKTSRPVSDQLEADNPSERKHQHKASAMSEHKGTIPWLVYGEGNAPQDWAQASDEDSADSLAAHVKHSLVHSTASQAWSLGKFLDAVLHQGMRAGCCTVKTSSGDWAEACAAAQAESDVREKTSKESCGTTPAGCRSCFKPSCLGDATHYCTLSEATPGADGPESPDYGAASIQLRCSSPDHAVAQLLLQLIDHHVPADVCRKIRIGNTAVPDTARWWESSMQGTYNLVVVEANAHASREAVLAACQSGDDPLWPSEAAKGNIHMHTQLILDSFHALQPGGHLLFCSGSLAREETDGLIEHCTDFLKGDARYLDKPLASTNQAADAMAVALKKWGIEKTDFGWRLLPDLSFQGPQYFSIIKRL